MTVHLLFRFCSAGPDPVPAETVSKVSLMQTTSSSQSRRHECLHACMTKGWIQSCWINYKWFSILFGLNRFKWINRQNVLVLLCILLMEANAASGISKGWRRERLINQIKRTFRSTDTSPSSSTHKTSKCIRAGFSDIYSKAGVLKALWCLTTSSSSS